MPTKADLSFSLPLLKRAVGLFVALSAVITAIAYPIVRSYEQNRFEVIKARETGYLDASSSLINRTFFEIIGDLAVASRFSAIRDVRSSDLAAVFTQISLQYDRYQTIALLSPAGREVIRVQSIEGRAVAAADQELRDQSSCPCFKEALRPGPSQTYLSRVIRLSDREDGQDNEPIIQLARATAADNSSGIQGIVVFNYRARKMFEELQRIGDADSHNRINMLVSKEGDFLSNSLQAGSPLRQALEKGDGSFSEQFPLEWRDIATHDRGELRSEKGLFLFTTVYPLKQEGLENATQRTAWLAQFPSEQIDSYYAKLVLWIPKSSLFATSFARQPVGMSLIAFGYVMLAVVSAGLAFAQMKKMQEEITRRHAEEMERQAYTDSLTAVWNRRYFNEVTQRELLRSQRHYEPLALLLLDIDHFKRINDTYGHKAGDIVLKEFCRVCLGTLREIDIFARLGGEEFVALLPNTFPDNAIIAANRLRESVAAAKTTLSSGEEITFTVSIGVSCLLSSASDMDEILQDADHALYEAKRSGRNCVCSSPSCAIPET